MRPWVTREFTMNQNKRYEIMKRLAAMRPNPQSELEYSNPFELLVAVVLSAQATDKGVNIATRKLFPIANTPKAIADLGVDGLIPFIKTIGLFRNKAKNVVALSKILHEQYQDTVPDNRQALESLPGVGRKTANVVLNVAFGHPTLAVDTHIFRVANRTGFAKGDNVQQVEERLLKVMPKNFLKDSHHWLLLHGRYCCKAQKPDCLNCPIYELCEYKEKLRPAAQ